MTDTVPAKPDAATEEEVEYQIVYLESGAPLIIGGGMDAIDDMKEQGYQAFYALVDLEFKTKGQNNVEQKFTLPRLVKVVNHIVGSAVVEVDSVDLGGASPVNTMARFGLPKIPFEIINEIDEFFRHIYATQHSEAIVVFVYDRDKLNSDDPSSGWSYVVPTQVNSAGSCHYEPESLVDEMVDMGTNWVQVGSAHSHPAMSAFASHTDEGDQSEFDGVHITYGWKAGSKATEYHIELVMAGGRFNMTEAQAFTETAKPSGNEKILELAKKVSKVTHTPKAGGQDWSGGYNGGTAWNQAEPKLPEGYEHLHPDKVTLIRKVLVAPDELKECPVCDYKLVASDLKSGYCFKCHAFFLAASDTVEGLIKRHRNTVLNSKKLSLDFIDGEPYKDVWLWEEQISEDKSKITDTVTRLHEGKGGGGSPKGEGGVSPRYCTACGLELEWIIRGTCATCGVSVAGYDSSYTGDPLTNQDQLEFGAEAKLECLGCQHRNPLNFETCWECDLPLANAGIVFDDDYDDDVDMPPVDSLSARVANAQEVFDLVSNIAERLRMCCMRDVDTCDCRNPIGFRTVDDAALQILDEPYAKLSAAQESCSDCLLQYTAGCKPYVDQLKKWVDDQSYRNHDDAKLTPCELFVVGR